MGKLLSNFRNTFILSLILAGVMIWAFGRTTVGFNEVLFWQAVARWVHVVAGILWKRIDTDNALGVDATSRYELDDWNDRSGFLQHLRDPEDPYNSRLRKGLPPTAIGNPVVSSLEAAIAPVKSEHWYYLHDAQGNLHPARNAAEHEANRKKFNVY